MKLAARWIIDWSEIRDQTYYIVCPINRRMEGGQPKELYLGQPIERMKGWGVKRLMVKCYAALECPEFVPAEHGLT